jgi:hypothetical protein
MGKYKLIVMSEPVEGREAEYNSWYNDEHLRDVVAAPGFSAAQRFELTQLWGGELKHRYMAIYEIDSDDHAAAMRELMSRAGTSAMPLSEALDKPNLAFGVFEECSPVVLAPARSK